MTMARPTRKDGVTATGETTATGTAQLGTAHDVGGEVVAGDDEPTGVVTERDLVVSLAEELGTLAAVVGAGLPPSVEARQ